MRRTGSRRSLRLGDAIMREIAELLEEKVQDPRLNLVTVSGVRVNADLRVAEVLYTAGGGEERMAEAAQALAKAAPFLRRELASRLDMRRLPELRFVRDVFLEDVVYAGQDDSPTDT